MNTRNQQFRVVNEGNGPRFLKKEGETDQGTRRAQGEDDFVSESDAHTSEINELAFLREQLSQPMEHPTWGPKFKRRELSRSENKARWRGRRDDSGDSEYQPCEQDRAIIENYEQSRRYYRYAPLYFVAAIFTAIVAGIAGWVDYEIINEFWSRAMAQETLMQELPSWMASSVSMRSLQVIFVIVAIHLVLRFMPKPLLAAFTLLLFLVASISIVSLSFQVANRSLPESSEATLSGGADDESLGGVLSELGLATESTAAADEEISEEMLDSPFFSWLKDRKLYDLFAWFSSFAAIFFITAGVGALFLVWAEHNLVNTVIATDFKNRKVLTKRWMALEGFDHHHQ